MRHRGEAGIVPAFSTINSKRCDWRIGSGRGRGRCAGAASGGTHQRRNGTASLAEIPVLASVRVQTFRRSAVRAKSRNGLRIDLGCFRCRAVRLDAGPQSWNPA